MAVYDNTITAREYLGYIAEQAGGFACIGRDGKLYIKTIGQEEQTIPLQYFQNFTWGEKWKVSRVKYEDGVRLFEKGDETANTIYISQDNMYIEKQEQINQIYTVLNELELYSFEGDSIIDPAVDVGDILNIDGKKIIYQGSSEYKGKFKANINSKIQSKVQEETTTRNPSQATINRRIQSRIDQEEGNIQILAQKQEVVEGEMETLSTQYAELNENVDEISMTVSETEAKLNNDYMTTEQIEAENSTVKEDLEIIKQQQAEMKLTSDGLRLDINRIENEGVTTVKNTLIDLNQQGIKVSKGEEFSSLIDDTGMYLKSYEKDIASYTKDGANIYNLTVENEAVIGNLRCLSVDVNNETRTHIHWIGG